MKDDQRKYAGYYQRWIKKFYTKDLAQAKCTPFHLGRIVVCVVPEPVSVSCVGDDVTAREVCHDQALPRKGQVGR